MWIKKCWKLSLSNVCLVFNRQCSSDTESKITALPIQSDFTGLALTMFFFFFIIQVWLTLKGTFQSMVLPVNLTSWVPTDHTTNEECGPLISPCLIYTIHPSRQRSFTFFKHCSVNSGNHANCCHRHPWLLMRFRWKLCIHWRRKDSQALLIGFKLSSHTEEASVRWWVTSPQHIGFIF